MSDMTDMVITIQFQGHPDAETYGSGGICGLEERVNAIMETHPTLSFKVDDVDIRVVEPPEERDDPMTARAYRQQAVAQMEAADRCDPRHPLGDQFRELQKPFINLVLEKY